MTLKFFHELLNIFKKLSKKELIDFSGSRNERTTRKFKHRNLRYENLRHESKTRNVRHGI